MRLQNHLSAGIRYILNIPRTSMIRCLTTGQPTVYALSTAPGVSGIAVVRVSGPQTLEILSAMTRRQKKLTPRHLTQSKIFCQKTHEMLDQGMVVWFPGPNSYTGEDMCEFHVHGSTAVVKDVLTSIGQSPGCVMAEPGEFTKRALLNSKLNILQVEGLSDLLNAETSVQRRLALSQTSGDLDRMLDRWRTELVWALSRIEAFIDFGEDEMIDSTVVKEARSQILKIISELVRAIEASKNAERLKSGFRVLVAGEPNVGKSSLVNKIAGRPASIVTPVAGTTRDTVDLSLDVDGYPVVLTDTAGLREAQDQAEIEGVRRARERISHADLVLLVTDSTLPHLEVSIANQLAEIDGIKPPDTRVLTVINKSDLAQTNLEFKDALTLSCETSQGISGLMEKVTEELRKIQIQPSTPMFTRARQLSHIALCLDHLTASTSESQADLLAESLRLAVHEIGLVTGRVGVEEMLDVLFKDFCIGK